MEFSTSWRGEGVKSGDFPQFFFFFFFEHLPKVSNGSKLNITSLVSWLSNHLTSIEDLDCLLVSECFPSGVITRGRRLLGSTPARRHRAIPVDGETSLPEGGNVRLHHVAWSQDFPQFSHQKSHDFLLGLSQVDGLVWRYIQHSPTYIRTVHCMKANYPYAIKSQRGATMDATSWFFMA